MTTAEVIARLIEDFNDLKEQCAHLVEENQNLKQKNQNIQQEIQTLKEKLQEKDKQLEKLQKSENQNLQQEIQILKEKLQEKDKQLEKLQKSENQYEKLEQNIKDLENQKSEELQQLEQLEIISKNIRNSLGIKNLNKVDDNKVHKEKCEPSLIKKDNHEQKNHNINNNQIILSLNNNNINSDNSSIYSLSLGKDTEKSGIYSDIQVVIGLDFGSASYARSFHNVGNQGIGIFQSYSYKQNNIIHKQNAYKTLCCDTQFSNYLKIVELYKLHLGNLSDSNSQSNSYLHINDPLRNIGKDIKNTIASYPNIKYFENVLLVLTVSMEYLEKDEAIMRERVHDAKLVRNKSSEKIQFITESEAAAIYCIKNELQKYNLSTGEPFIIVDCGESTIDITTHEFVENNPLQLSEITQKLEDSRRTSDGKISKFISLVERGTKVSPDQTFTFNFKPESGQTHAKFEVYCVNEESVIYFDEPGMELLGVLNADLPDANLDNRSINFGLSFGPNKITAFTSNKLNGQRFEIKFNY
ncbi:unnamed protein product [Rhizophagus irregularis]|uniref:Hsp70 family protein n=1 Tax=Rhizophagus irregularis TaxID=588596 RepID=A0A915ZNF3_9GLOM|nr:unnamed protein product [Rhizophagus irregularis]